MRDTQIARNFWLSEATRTDRRGFKRINREMGRRRLPMIVLMAQTHMQRIRDLIGRWIHCSSWYRCPELNFAVGGVSGSEHMRAQAVDFWVKGWHYDRKKMRAVFDKICADYIKNGVMFGQIIFEERRSKNYSSFWIHLSLGYPFRPLNTCGQMMTALVQRGQKTQYVLIDQLDYAGWA